MKLLITGSQDIKSFDLSQYIAKDVEIIISCDAEGIETIAEQYADAHNISKLIIRQHIFNNELFPSYDEILTYCDFVLIIWNGKSQDVVPMIKCVNKHTKPVKIILYQES